ncbi:LysR family transcriptional regulator [Micromonospora maritima]|uniref:LysR family transcriptional regulator n=1 Tax=Micromonospora maritima TaxID=986711 RepID=A0ABW7ZJB4_9ACTN
MAPASKRHSGGIKRFFLSGLVGVGTVDLERVRAFVATAEWMNFTTAAEELRLAQPSLSARIRALEADLGVELFSRRRRQVELTAAGRAFLRPRHRLPYDRRHQADLRPGRPSADHRDVRRAGVEPLLPDVVVEAGGLGPPAESLVGVRSSRAPARPAPARPAPGRTRRAGHPSRRTDRRT